ncbi:mucin-16 [Sagmatias obliquidens]|uniref:mucin-16 n=1 Tax=Sagmatias obliquidens TaxID=3371155 RepID=UPI000F4448D0|nr:mucin-16-like [Lagenorhynchus obliquidens]
MISPTTSQLPSSTEDITRGTIKEVTDSPGLLKTTDILGISLESGTTSSPNWKNGTYERIATSEPTTDKETIYPSTNTVDITNFGLGKTRDMLRTSLETDTSLPPNLRSSSDEMFVTTDIEAIHPSTNTAMTHVETTSCEHESHSPVLAPTQPPKAKSSVVTSSTMWDTTAPTSMSGSSETIKIERESVSSLNTGLRETSTYQETSSATETSTVISNVSTNDATTEVTRTQVTSSSRKSIPSLAHFKTSPNTLTESRTSPSISMFMTESSGMTITTQTGPPGVTSQDTLTLDILTKISGAGTHSTVTQSSTHSEMTTLSSRGPEDVSWPSPASVKETGSPTSPVIVPAMTTPSPEPSTLPGRSPSSPTPVTSLLIRGLGKTKDTLGTSVEPVSSSPSSEMSTTIEILSTSEASTGTDAIQPSKNTAETHRANTISGHEAHSSAPAESEPSNVTSPMVTPSPSRDTSVSTSMPHSLETTMFEIHSTSSLTPPLRKPSTVQQNSTATEKIAIPSKVPTDTTIENSRTEPISPSSTSIPGPVQYTLSPDIPAGIISGPSASPVPTESAEVTMTTQTGPIEPTSQDPLTLDTTTNTSGVEIHSTVTQSFTHPEMSTLSSRGPEDVSWPSPASVIETGSPSSPVIVPAMTKPSPEPRKLLRRSPSSPTPVTSLLTRGLRKTRDTLDTSVEPVPSSPSTEMSTTIEILSTSEASTGTDAIQPSKNTGGINGANESSGHETHSSAPADSEPSNVTFQMLIPSNSRDTRVSTSVPNSLETTVFELDSISSLTPELRNTSTVQQNSSATEKIGVLSKVPTDMTTEISRTEPNSSSSTSIAGPVQSTMSPDIPEGLITRPSASPVTTESAEVTTTTQTGPIEATSHDPLTLGATTNTTGAEIHSTVTQSFMQPEMTTLSSRGPEDASWPSPASVIETGSPSSPVTVPTRTTPSPEPSTLSGRSPSSPTPVTSLLNRGLWKTRDTLGTNVEPVSSSPSSEMSTTIEILSTSEASTGTDAIQPSKNTAGTHRANTISGHEAHSSAPAESEPSNVTSPMVTPSPSRDTSVSTSMPHSLETTMFEIHSTSSLTPPLRKPSTVQQNSTATEKIAVPSKVPTDTTIENSRTESISPSSTSIPVPVRYTLSPDIPAGIITGPSASPVPTESAEVTMTTQTGPIEPTSQDPLTLDTTSNTSGVEIHSTVTQSFMQPEMSTLSSRGPEDVFWPSPASVIETGSPSSPVIVPAMTKPSPEPRKLLRRSPSSPTPVTSLLTRGLWKTRDTLGTSVEPVPSSPSTEMSTTIEILSTSEASTGTDAIQPSKNTVIVPTMRTHSPEPSTLSGRSPSSPTPVTSVLTRGLGKTEDRLGTTLVAVTTLPPTLSSPTVEIISTSEFSIDTAKILPPLYTIMSTVGSSSSGHELSSSVPIFPESSSTTYPMGTASSVYETTPSSSMRSSFETKTLSHLTPRLKETRIALDSSSSTLTNTPSSPLSTHGLKGPRTDATSSVKVSAPDQPLSTQYTDIPVETVTRFYTSLSITRSAGITVPESNLSVPVSENTRYLSTDMLSSAETIFANNTLTPYLSEPMASFATSGVPGAISVSPFSRTESGPGDATMPTTAESLPSSASIPFPSLTFRTTDSSTSPLPHWITSSPATPRIVDTNLEAESQSTAALPLVTAGTLQTWTQPVRTSLPPITDTRMTESVGLGTVTSSSQVLPHSTQLTRTDGIVEHITKIPNEAAHGDTTVHVPLASTSASLRGLSTGGKERAETTAMVLKTTSTVTLTTRVSTPTSGMLSLLRTSDKTASISTTGMISTTPDVPKMTASFVTRPGDKTSTVVPMTTPSIFNRGPQTTPSLVPSSGAETSAAVPTLTVSFGEPETTTSWVTHPAETSPTVSRAILNVSHSESDSTPPTATSSGEEVSSAVPTPTVSPDVLGVVTSLVTSSGTETSSVDQTLTVSPGYNHQYWIPTTSSE